MRVTARLRFSRPWRCSSSCCCSTVGVAANSSAGCSACHASQSDALAASAHASIACTVCHAAPPGQVAARVDVVVRMVPASIGGVDLDGPGRPIGSGPCIECHEDVLSGGVLSKNGLRIDHLACASGHLTVPRATRSRATGPRRAWSVRRPCRSAPRATSSRGVSVACDDLSRGQAGRRSRPRPRVGENARSRLGERARPR